MVPVKASSGTCKLGGKSSNLCHVEVAGDAGIILGTLTIEGNDGRYHFDLGTIEW